MDEVAKEVLRPHEITCAVVDPLRANALTLTGKVTAVDADKKESHTSSRLVESSELIEEYALTVIEQSCIW